MRGEKDKNAMRWCYTAEFGSLDKGGSGEEGENTEVKTLRSRHVACWAPGRSGGGVVD